MRAFITQHCRNRYMERVGKTPNSLQDIAKIVESGTDVTNKIFDAAPRFILHLYTKYKTANIKIIFKDGVHYITTKRKGADNLYDVMTCYQGDDRFKMYANSVIPRKEIYFQIGELKRKLKKESI